MCGITGFIGNWSLELARAMTMLEDDQATYLEGPPSQYAVMSQLGRQMEGFRRSIEYIQDYVDLAGLKMWQEELGRVKGYMKKLGKTYIRN